MNELPDQIVNYVWINKVKFPNFDPDDTEKLCGVPLHYLDKTIHNAKRYPHAQFNVWIDWRFLDQTSRFWVDSYIYSKNCSNINVCDLMNVPSYAAEKDFNPNVGKDIWAKVDYARLLVLQHILNENLRSQVFYSDFDAIDVEILKPRIQDTISQYGMVIATTKCNYFENSFFGINVSSLSNINALVNITKPPFKRGVDGYNALHDFLEIHNFFPPVGVSDVPYNAVKEMPISGIGSISAKKFHQKLQLC